MWTVVELETIESEETEAAIGYPQMVLVTLEDDFGRRVKFECAQSWIQFQEINEGDEWPEDIETPDESMLVADTMSAWMDNYYSALEEMDE